MTKALVRLFVRARARVHMPVHMNTCTCIQASSCWQWVMATAAWTRASSCLCPPTCSWSDPTPLLLWHTVA